MFRKNIILFIPSIRHASSVKYKNSQYTVVCGREYPRDNWTNVTERVLTHVGKNLHLQPHHPLSLLRQKIVHFFHKSFVGRSGNAIFAVLEDLDPVVSVEDNFESLLVPENHPSRQKSDCYYLNKNQLLRGHTTAHQSRLINMGLNNFLIVGDVYRRDEIDATHYPVFHQLDGVRLCTAQEVFKSQIHKISPTIFDENTVRTDEIQEHYSKEASSIMSSQMLKTLENMAIELFGKDIETRWVHATFPFTHPSWELEINYKGNWMEVLGCGIIEQKILRKAGAINHIGWAFGLGLERLAMQLYQIPDIRLFWSTDTGFLSQFRNADINTPVVYKPISIYPQCSNDISFWLSNDHPFSPKDFYELARDIGGDIIEQVSLIDEFFHPKKKLTSHCYRITYRHMEKTLTQEEVNKIHKEIENAVISHFYVTVR